MKKILTLVAAILICAAPISAQQQTALFLESTSPTGVQESFYKQVSERNLVDNHIYTCGATLNNSGTYDILLSKYTLANVLVWTVTYTSTGNDNDYATDLTFDATGNIIICGAVQIGTLDYDAITLKYDGSGALLWSQTYAGAGNGPDALTCAVTDANNNVYVSGGTYASIAQLTNMLLIKYNSTGTQQWASTWNNGTYNMQDASFRILLSGNYANCYGATQTSASPVTWKLANAQFYQSNGNLNGSSTSYGDNEDFAEVKDIIVESNYYVTACGYSTASGQGKNLKVTKFNQTLSSIWNYTYNNTSNNDDVANSIELYGSLLYVGGYTTLADGTKDIVVAKLNYNIGTTSWLTTHDGGTGENDEAIDLATDGTGQLYLCGNSYKVGNSDYYIAKIKNTTGAVLAQNHFNGANNLDDIASNMVVTSTGDIYIAGQTGVSGASGNSFKYALTKWSEKTVWVPVPSDGYSNSAGYISNHGQILNTDTTSNTSVKFYCDNNGINTYIDDLKISYVLIAALDNTNSDTLQRIDMTFTKGASGIKSYPIKERDEQHHFDLAYMTSESFRTPSYNAVIRSGAYTNTDVIYTQSENGFRHWIVARSGAPTSDFEMTFNGQSSLSVDGSGKLVITTAIGHITYSQAKAYNMNNTTGALTLLGWQPAYTVNGSKVSFTSFGTWNGTLVLEFGEPLQALGGGGSASNMDWSTYVSGNLRDRFCDVKADADGNIYAVGFTESTDFPIGINQPIDIPVDAFGDYDALIVKFDTNYRLVWTARYGSNRWEQFSGLTLIGSLEGYQIVAVGSTNSANLDWPAAENEYYAANNSIGNVQREEAMVVKIDAATAVPLWGTFLGTAYKTDIGTDVVADNFGNIFICGTTESEDANTNACDTLIENTFPICAPNSSAYQSAYAGNYDIFITKFNTNNELVWSTMMGNNERDIAYEMAIVPGSGDIMLVGMGSEGAFEGNYTESYTETSGGWGGVAYRFSNGGVLKWSSSFPTIFAMHSVDVYLGDEGVRIAMVGTTKEGSMHLGCEDQEGLTLPICTPTGAYADTLREGHEAYLMELNSTTMQVNWATYFGGNTSERVEQMMQEESWADENTYPFADYFFLATQARKHMDIAHDKEGNIFVNGISTKLTNEDADFPELNYDGYYQQELWPNAGEQFDVWIAGFTADRERYWTSALGGYVSTTELFYQDQGSEIIMEMMFNDSGLYCVGFSQATNYPLQCPSAEAHCETAGPNNAQDAVITHFILDASIVIAVDENIQTLSQGLMLFPNPTHSNLHIALNNNSDIATYSVYDNFGRLVTTNTFRGSIPLDVSHWSAGQYFVRIKTNNKTQTACFIKE
jgi:hypothetical protein